MRAMLESSNSPLEQWSILRYSTSWCSSGDLSPAALSRPRRRRSSPLLRPTARVRQRPAATLRRSSCHLLRRRVLSHAGEQRPHHAVHGEPAIEVDIWRVHRHAGDGQSPLIALRLRHGEGHVAAEGAEPRARVQPHQAAVDQRAVGDGVATDELRRDGHAEKRAVWGRQERHRQWRALGGAVVGLGDGGGESAVARLTEGGNHHGLERGRRCRSEIRDEKEEESDQAGERFLRKLSLHLGCWRFLDSVPPQSLLQEGRGLRPMAVFIRFLARIP